MPARVLVTGFLPFDGHTSNISGEVARRLAEESPVEVLLGAARGVQHEVRRRRVDIEFDSCVLTVDEAGSRRVADSSHQDLSAIIHLGLATDRNRICIERRAGNRLDFKVPDESGRMCAGVCILESVGAWLASSAPTAALEVEFEADGRLEMSDDAGGFVCNETYLRTLAAVEDAGATDAHDRPLPVLFVHLPPATSLAMDEQMSIIRKVAAVTIQRPMVRVVGAVIERQGMILCCRRATGHRMAGFWEFPGGKPQPGESERQALVREIEEELSIEIEPMQRIARIEHAYPDLRVEIAFWSARIGRGEPVLRVHDAIEWVDRADLSDFDWLAADLPLIERLTAQSSSI